MAKKLQNKIPKTLRHIYEKKFPNFKLTSYPAGPLNFQSYSGEGSS